jgi:hypothetical protein
VENTVLCYLDGSGAALNAETSCIVFNAPVTVAHNNNTSGAGGAFYLKLSNVTFNAAANVQNNSASGWNEVGSYCNTGIAIRSNVLSMCCGTEVTVQH